MIALILALHIITATELDCQARNIYYEARNEPESGQYAVMDVVHNRSHSDLYPHDICKVIYQKAQFSWTLATKPEPRKKELDEIKLIVLRYYNGLNVGISNDALWYHANYVKPVWANNKTKVNTIGQHIFYK